MNSLTLSPLLDAAAAQGLKNDLLAHRGEPLELDGSLVQRLGGVCLQILVSARKTWAADGQTLRFTAPTQALCDAMERFGAQSLLQEQV